jgi:hypothetical protein
MSLINEPLKHTRNAAPKAGTSQPVTSIYRIESKSDSTGAKGNFLATILIAGVVLVVVIVLGSRIASRVQNVKDGFASDTDATAVETKPTPPASKPVVEPAPMPELSPTLK